MSVELFRYPSYAWGLLIIMAIMLILILFIIHFFVPKVMQCTYFKEPYFSPFEVDFFTGFPFAYMRTAMMMRLAGWPESGKKRGIPANAHEVAPVWFQVVSRLFVRTIIIVYSLIIIVGIVLGIAFTALDMW